jgi:hypothetical protein
VNTRKIVPVLVPTAASEQKFFISLLEVKNVGERWF